MASVSTLVGAELTAKHTMSENTLLDIDARDAIPGFDLLLLLVTGRELSQEQRSEAEHVLTSLRALSHPWLQRCVQTLSRLLVRWKAGAVLDNELQFALREWRRFFFEAVVPFVAKTEAVAGNLRAASADAENLLSESSLLQHWNVTAPRAVYEALSSGAVSQQTDAYARCTDTRDQTEFITRGALPPLFSKPVAFVVGEDSVVWQSQLLCVRLAAQHAARVLSQYAAVVTDIDSLALGFGQTALQLAQQRAQVCFFAQVSLFLLLCRCCLFCFVFVSFFRLYSNLPYSLYCAQTQGYRAGLACAAIAEALALLSALPASSFGRLHHPNYSATTCTWWCLLLLCCVFIVAIFLYSHSLLV